MLTRLGSQVAVIALAAGAVGVCVPLGQGAGASAAAMPPVAAAAHEMAIEKVQTSSRHPQGLYVTGDGKVTNATGPSAYVVDLNRHEHLVTLSPATGHQGEDRVLYYTRPVGATRWIVHAAPQLINGAGSPRVEVSVARSGQVFVVVYACDAVYAARVGPAAHRLPEFTMVQTENLCGNSNSEPDAFTHLSAGVAFSYAPTVDSHVGVYNLELIAPDPTNPGQWDFILGAPGRRFASVATVPAADGFVPIQLIGGANRLTQVVGYGVDKSGNEGIFTTISYLKNFDPKDNVWGWSPLKEVATLGKPDADYTIESFTESFYATDIGLYAAPGSRPAQHHTLFDVRGKNVLGYDPGAPVLPSDRWFRAVGIDHTTLNDADLILTMLSGDLHATYERSIAAPASARTKQSGIMNMHETGTHWTKPTFATHWYKDRPLHVSLHLHYAPSVEYLQN